MTDRNDSSIGDGAFGPEPRRDAALGALLRAQVGEVPRDVEWDSLASRISARIAAHVSAPWWAYASRWERRVVPIALAAGLAAAVALARLEAPATSPTFVSASSVSTDIVNGTSFEDAARRFARSVTIAGDVTATIPE
jgi:hypothetical protein